MKVAFRKELPVNAYFSQVHSKQPVMLNEAETSMLRLRPATCRYFSMRTLGDNDSNTQMNLCPALECLTTSLKVKVKVHTLDIALLCSESPPQKRSGMARVLKGFHSFTCTPTRSSAIGMSHTCLCLPSYNWYSFTDPGGMEG